jgi:hypothetical protein
VVPRKLQARVKIFNPGLISDLASPKSTLASAQKKEGLHNNKRSVGNEEPSNFLFFLQFQNVPIAKPSIEIEGTPVSTELFGHLFNFSIF